MRLGPLLRERRRALGLKTAEAAERLGVRQSAYSKWENEQTKPDSDRLGAIAEFLGVTRAEVVLMRDDDNGAGGSDDRIEAVEGRVSAIEDRLGRIEGQLAQMIQLLRDLDRRIQGRSPGDSEGG